MVDYGRKIAKVSLDTGAIILNPENPFTWASGYRMPIYNDNRLLLGSYKNRVLVGGALIEGASNLENNSFDTVAGTSTAGIAPAATVARIHGCPLLVIDNEELFSFDLDSIYENSKNIESLTKNSDVIASTCPFAIPYGVILANTLKFPFIYVRPEKKAHGMGKQIEGNLGKNQKVFLVDYNIGESYKSSAIKAIEDASGVIAGEVSENIKLKIKCDGVEGTDVVVIEDLISTGGSSVKEVEAYRKKGANVAGCVSIFNYSLDKATNVFQSADCEVRSALTYDKLLQTAKDTGYIDEDAEQLLDDWRAEPFKWGEKHGFPRAGHDKNKKNRLN